MTARRIVLVVGPPFTPALLGAAVARLRARAPSLEVVVRSATTLGDSAEAAASALAGELRPDDLLVAHGFAVPLALRARAATGALAGCILVNGPLRAGHPALRLAAGAGALAAGLVGLGPLLWRRWLWSSSGLRRAVNNPYVMDRDTVAAVTTPADAPQQLRADWAYFRAAGGLLAAGAPLRDGVTLLWGGADALFPLADLERGGGALAAAPRRVVPGGRWLWPHEMPWAFADAVLELSGADTTTSAPQSGTPGAAGRAGISLGSEEEAGLV